jgi:hypothetical protein
MLGYRKRSFTRAHAMLTSLRAKENDLETLRTLQQLLLGETIRAERRVRDLKLERKNTAKMGGAHAAKRSSYLITRIEGLRQCAYVWRCFGDAIAFTYMDRFSLKQCYYSVDKPQSKQGAGSIADKSGLLNEIGLLEFALQKGVPALLTDLTNTIRHGDVCLMGGPDPYLIEVKTSNHLNSRGKRQRRALAKLQRFFESDYAEGLRGIPYVRRQEIGSPERTHTGDLNACIADAEKNGQSVVSPERGLFYIALARNAAKKVEDVLGSLDLKDPWVFVLNEYKAERAWAPYLPFTLSIEDRDSLWDFIRGDLFLIVIVELGALTQIALDGGYKAEFDRDNTDYPLQVCLPGVDGAAGVSAQMLARIGLEFVSPEWLVISSIETIKHGADAARDKRQVGV